MSSSSSFETRQNVDCIGQARRVHHPIDSRVIPNPNLFNAFANVRHWLVVVRQISLLYFDKLAACVLTRVLRKTADDLQRVPKELDFFHISIISI